MANEKNTMVLCRKIQLIPVGDKDEVNRVYNYIRDGMFNQNKAMNQYMTALYMSTIQEISAEDRKELNRLYTRISTSPKGSAYTEDIQFPVGLPTTSSLGMKVRQDFSKACKEGLLYGKISLPTYRMDNPLLIHGDYVKLMSTNDKNNGLYHTYSSHEEFLDHLYSNDCDIYIKFANNITFKVVLGSLYKSRALRYEMQCIFEERYRVCGSSIQIDGKKLILNMSIEIPKRKLELDENVVVGVDLGTAVPAVCSLNTDKYIKAFIGDKDDSIRVKTQLQAQRRRLQKSLRRTNGGHGRNKKMKALDRLELRERNFIKTYNHFISKKIIDFAVEHKAQYINIEDTTGMKEPDFILHNWANYELQEFIAYKADQFGIIVRKVNPANTSQTCSCCGNLEDGQRVDQEHFVCKACGAELNADFNASRNIAMSVDFTEKKSKKKKKKEEHDETTDVKSETTTPDTPTENKKKSKKKQNNGTK